MVSLTALVGIVATLFLAMFCSWALLLPFFQEESEADSQDRSRMQALVTKKETLMVALEDLEMEFRSEKISEEDYRSAKIELTSSAARCIAEIKSISSQEVKIEQDDDKLRASRD